ncbi:MAG TPA: bifunctional 4-hydroxy-2-oxoglutarate aldolase/2-dehydro-3-deoxy-phosphogluconate aldolase [Terriglobales bacterium]|nr:bifunctional 4-hydroxy-2-oxoglutarate aldolase/2-dehydro-3-deoxy-phosphogluconate aldolase [Terriglobales bacterium]
MKIEDVTRRIGEIGIVPVVRAAGVEEARQAVDAILAGGIPVVEITMTVPGAVEVIRSVTRQFAGKVLVGAGTVVTREQALACLDAGAQFLVSPGLSVAMMRAARERNTLAIPGALTPTELMAATAEGAEVIKIFPCGSVGGPKYLKALRGPFPSVKVIPTGGVNAGNAAEYIAAGAFAIGVGSDLVDTAALRQGKPEKIVTAAKELVAAVQGARKAA